MNDIQNPAPAVTQNPAATAAQMDANAISSLIAEVIALRAKVEGKEDMPKGPVSDEDLSRAIARLEAEAQADLKEANPKATPNLGLSAILNLRPDMTAEQKKDWAKRRDAMRKAYSDKHRELLSARKALFNRVARDKSAIVATSANQRKDGTYSRVALAVKQPGKKPRSKGKKAKPSQIAAKVPAAPNANPPAQIQ